MTPDVVLTAGLAEMNTEVTPNAKQKLLAYLALLQKWNKVYNLTAVRDPLDMVTLHLLDSLSVLPYIKTGNLLDVGSGGGLPGIVLAIMKPDLQVTTIDTVQKKTIFMRQVKGELGLPNLEVVHARVEQFQPTEKFDAIITRAFSDIGLLIKLTQHLLAPHGHWLAMKGVVPHHEFEGLNIRPKEIIPLKVAGLQAERHLVVIESNA
ncbi:MAG TPA: 16S rRNA (guanine(527)-N(7))-methyltransferase RsmG [Methylotenera sp.]|nr:16S rRNA (guanine(527)-N(7))-methyltransferase RsmG [Methylotenera sp.]